MNDATHISPFDAIRRVSDDGSEYWSARDLSKILGYKEWRNFTTAIEKAKEACEGSGQSVSDHFVEANKMVKLGSGAQRKTEDYLLSRRDVVMIDYYRFGQSLMSVSSPLLLLLCPCPPLSRAWA